MRTSDSVERVKYRIEFRRTDEYGSNSYYYVDVPLSPTVLKAAEDGDPMKQYYVMKAFEDRFPRAHSKATLPEDIVWSDFIHPIQPSPQVQP